VGGEAEASLPGETLKEKGEKIEICVLFGTDALASASGEVKLKHHFQGKSL